MEKCLYFWLNYIRKCSPLTFSTKIGKVFVFLVKLYKKVFSSDIFNYVVTFLSTWSWESDWSPALVDWSCCSISCLFWWLPGWSPVHYVCITSCSGGHLHWWTGCVVVYHVCFGGCLAGHCTCALPGEILYMLPKLATMSALCPWHVHCLGWVI